MSTFSQLLLLTIICLQSAYQSITELLLSYLQADGWDGLTEFILCRLALQLGHSGELRSLITLLSAAQDSGEEHLEVELILTLKVRMSSMHIRFFICYLVFVGKHFMARQYGVRWPPLEDLPISLPTLWCS